MANELVKDRSHYKSSVDRYGCVHPGEWNPTVRRRGHGVIWTHPTEEVSDFAPAFEKFAAPRPLFLVVNHDNPHDEPHEAEQEKGTYLEVLAGASAGLIVLGIGCIVGSAFAFGAAAGYGLSPEVGIGIVLAGLLVIVVGGLLAAVTAHRMPNQRTA
jgi:hypothetical protein